MSKDNFSSFSADFDDIKQKVNSAIAHLQEDNQNKESTINKMQVLLSNHKDRLSKLQTKYDTQQKELEEAKKEIESYKLHTSNLILIGSVKQVVKYPKTVIGEYLKVIDWEDKAFADIVKLLYLLLKNDHCTFVEYSLIRLNEKRLRGLSHDDLYQLLNFLEAYLKYQSSNDCYNIDAFRGFINSIDKLKWYPLLKLFLACNYELINSILIEVSDKQNVLQMWLILAKFYLYNDSGNCVEIMRQLVPEICKSDNTILSKSELLEVLFILICCRMPVKNISIVVEEFVGTNEPEIQTYNLYTNLLENPLNVNDILPELGRLEKQRKSISDDLNIKAFKVINKLLKECLQSIEKQSTEKPKRFEDIKPNIIKKDQPPGKKLPKIQQEVFIIDENCQTCPKDKSQLTRRVCQLAYFNGHKKGGPQGHINEVNLLFCAKCNTYYILRAVLDEVKKSISITKLKVSEFKHIKPATNPVKNNIVGEVNWPLINVAESVNTLPSHLNLNEKSILGELGYSTKISKKERWDIITNYAIPRHGLQRVISVITGNITLRKRQKGGSDKYHDAIKQWEHDLYKIKEVYNNQHAAQIRK